MSRQIPLDVDTWADDRIDIAGEWPEALCVADLRYWNAGYGRDQGFKKPSIRGFAFCWSWQKDRAHSLIKRNAENAQTAIRQLADTAQTVGPVDTPNMPRQSDTAQTVARQQSDSPPRERSEAWLKAAQLFADLNPGRRAPKRTSGPGRALNARIVEHGIEKVVDVLTWAAKSDHDRARFLRKQKIGLKTLVHIDKFLIYLAFCTEAADPALVEGAWIEPAQESANRDEVLIWT